MTEVRHTLRILEELRALGVQVAIDDFGTGYSSLEYLQRFPIHVLKIDRSFVRGLPGGSEESAIVEAILAIGRSLDLSVIAEGVELESQAAFLCSRDCSYLQGYLFARPLAAAEDDRLPPEGLRKRGGGVARRGTPTLDGGRHRPSYR